MMNQEQHTDVLIIGGGPTGMLCAIYLDLLGVSSIVVERQYEISDHPKAHELSARSIEILCQLGFTPEALKEEASPHEDASRIVFGHTINTTLGEIDLLAGGNDEKYKTHLASPEPYLNLSQTALEKLMRKKLLECKKSRLLLGYHWERMDQKTDGVQNSILNRASNQHQNIHSKYVICADGAGSRSRNALGIDMLGQEKIEDFISVYFEHNLRDFLKKPAKLYWILNPAAPGTFIAHHIERRWVYHFPIFTPYEKKEQFSKAVLKARILTALGDKRIPLEIKSISFWRMTCQIATSFRKERAFLVGDAAHRFPPTGGLGMNSGIGDAQNLCWKLALVIKRDAHEHLLDTYELERRPVIELNSKESLYNYFKIWEVPQSLGLNPTLMKWQAILLNSMFLSILPKAWINGALRKIHRKLSGKILQTLNTPKALQNVKQAIAAQITHFDRIGLDLGYHYTKGAIVNNTAAKIPQQEVSHYQPSIAPGVRFPHFWVCVQGKKVSTHTWIRPDKFTLLCNDEGEAWWNENAPALPSRIRTHIAPINVTAPLEEIPKDTPQRTLYPIEHVPLLLIRPDGQIAWRPDTLDIDLNTVFNHLLPSPCV